MRCLVLQRRSSALQQVNASRNGLQRIHIDIATRNAQINFSDQLHLGLRIHTPVPPDFVIDLDEHLARGVSEGSDLAAHVGHQVPGQRHAGAREGIPRLRDCAGLGLRAGAGELGQGREGKRTRQNSSQNGFFHKELSSGNGPVLI
jgi:hypothetical protein